MRLEGKIAIVTGANGEFGSAIVPGFAKEGADVACVDWTQEDGEKAAEKVLAEGAKVVADAMLGKLFAPNLPAEAPIVASVRQLILNTAPAGIIGSLEGMAVRSDSSALLPDISVPMLILAGANDQVIAPDKAKAMADASKSATLTMVANAGHMPMLEQPDATATALLGFLSRDST